MTAPYGSHFTDNEVRFIRKTASVARQLGIPVRKTELQLATQFGCSDRTIQRIVNNETYKNVSQLPE